MTFSIRRPRTTLLAIAVAVSACATEHAVVATIDSGGRAGNDAGAGMSGADATGPLGGDGGSAEQAPGAGGSASTGGIAGASGIAGAAGTDNVGGTVTSAGLAGSAGMDSISFGGSIDTERGGGAGLGVAGAAGSFDAMMCTCLAEVAVVCTTDGFTYAASECFEECEASIECFQACPCDSSEPEPTDPNVWLSSDLAAMQCGGAEVCLGRPTSTFGPSEPCSTPPCLQ